MFCIMPVLGAYFQGFIVLFFIIFDESLKTDITAHFIEYGDGRKFGYLKRNYFYTAESAEVAESVLRALRG